MGKIKGFLFAVRHREILLTDLGLILFAQRQDIRKASTIIEEVEEVVMNFKAYAEKTGIDECWTRKIEQVLEENRK